MDIKMCVRMLLIPIIGLTLGGCKEEHRVSYELVMSLKEMKVTCADLKEEKIGKQFWVKSVLDGWGILVISKGNEAHQYNLSLISHGHERAIETRIIQCGPASPQQTENF